MKIIYPPLISWHMLPQSPQAYCRIFAENGIETYFMDSNHPAAERHTKRPFEAQRNLTVLPPGRDPRDYADTLFFSYPEHVHHAENFDKILYVLYDYHGDFLIDKLVKSIEVADIVVAISKELYNLALSLGCKKSKLLYIPNGLFFDEFMKEYEKPSILQDIEYPIVGYSGVISKEWTDIELIEEIAQDYSVVCTGSIFDGKLSDNIYNVGHIPKEDFPNFVKSFHIGILPFRNNKFSQHMDPLKFYHYCAAQIPVLTTNIPAVVNSKIPTYELKKENVESALKMDNPQLRGARLHYAKEHDWKTVLVPLVKRLKELD